MRRGQRIEAAHAWIIVAAFTRSGAKSTVQVLSDDQAGRRIACEACVRITELTMCVCVDSCSKSELLAKLCRALADLVAFGRRDGASSIQVKTWLVLLALFVIQIAFRPEQCFFTLL